MLHTSDADIKITHKLHKLMFLMDKVADTLLQRDLDIGFSQFMILIALSKKTDITQKVLSEFMNLTPGAISRHVEILNEKGFLKRVVNKDNRREHLVSLTSEGTTALENAYGILKRFFGAAFDTMATEKKEAFHETLDELLKHVMNSEEFSGLCAKDEAINYK